MFHPTGIRSLVCPHKGHVKLIPHLMHLCIMLWESIKKICHTIERLIDILISRKATALVMAAIFLLLMLPKAISVSTSSIYDEEEQSTVTEKQTRKVTEIAIEGMVRGLQNLNHSINLFIYMLTIKKFKMCTCYGNHSENSTSSNDNSHTHLKNNSSNATNTSNL